MRWRWPRSRLQRPVAPTAPEPRHPAPYVVGLTGGIGAGKSAVAERFVARGAELVDTDAIAHELTAAGGAAIAPIRAAFGDAVIGADGALERTAMRARAFADAGARARLEAILHPLIGAQAWARVAASRAPYVVLAVPLLVETGRWRERVDRVLVVDCSEAAQLARVQARSRLPAEQVRAIIAAQATRAQRRAVADDLIDNDGSLAALDAQVDRLHHDYLAQAHRKRASADPAG